MTIKMIKKNLAAVKQIADKMMKNGVITIEDVADVKIA